jgi:hypothetical protein
MSLRRHCHVTFTRRTSYYVQLQLVLGFWLSSSRDLCNVCRMQAWCSSYGTVCGVDGETYPSECTAWALGVLVDYDGQCRTFAPLTGRFVDKTRALARDAAIVVIDFRSSCASFFRRRPATECDGLESCAPPETENNRDGGDAVHPRRRMR